MSATTITTGTACSDRVALPDPRTTAHLLLEFADIVATAARRSRTAIDAAAGATFHALEERPEVFAEITELRAWTTDLADYAGQMFATILGTDAGVAIRTVIESHIPITELVEAWVLPDLAPWPTPRLWQEAGLEVEMERGQ